MGLSRLEVTSPSTVNLQTWGVDLRHPIGVGSDTPASSGELHFSAPLEGMHVTSEVSQGFGENQQK